MTVHLSVPVFVAIYAIIFGLIILYWRLLRAIERSTRDEMVDFAVFVLEVAVARDLRSWDWWGRFERWEPPASQVADSNDHRYPESAMIPSGGAK